MEILARAYLDIQHLKITCEARLRRIRKQKVLENILAMMERYYQALRGRIGNC